MNSTASRGMIVLLAAVTCTGPIAMQIYVPALPVIAKDLATTPAMAQLTLSLSMLAMAIATLVHGPASDRYGRRVVLLVGLAIFLLGSVLCALASNIELLIAARVVQAAGGAAGMVLARAIARDLYGATGAARVIAQLTLLMVAAPMVAAALGGALTDLLGWRSTFWTIVGVSLLIAYFTWRRLPESLPPERRDLAAELSPFGVFRGAATLFRSRRYSAYIVQTAFTSSVFFSFVSGAPYVMHDVLKRPTTEYGLYFVLVSLGFMVGNYLSLQLQGRVAPDRLLLSGSLTSAIFVLSMVLLVFAGWLSPLTLFIPMFLASIGSGIVMPNGQAAAINVFPERAGAASGVAGFSQLLVAATVSQLIGVLQNHTAWPMILSMFVCTLTALLAISIVVWKGDASARGDDSARA